MQFQLPFPATEPPCDITPAIKAITVMRCPFCGSDDVGDFTPEGFNPVLTIEAWECFDCGQRFDGWDHIPHPYQATLLYRCPVCGTTGTEPKECPRCARVAVEARRLAAALARVKQDNR